MKKGTKYALAYVLVLAMLLAMMPTSVLAYSQVKNGSRGQDVKTMQTMLNKVMNAGLVVDGICGAKSVQAIKNFQKQYGLTVDGICGANTWAKLEKAYNGAGKKTSQPKTASRSIVRSGSRGQDVKTMQTMLNKVMNAGLAVDGVCGTISVTAIKNFQKAAGLTVDGICGANTWTKLESFYNSGKVLSSSETSNSSKTSNSDVSYTYVTMKTDVSSFKNWLDSIKKNETSACGLQKGIIVGAKVKSYKTVVWDVPSKAQGPKVGTIKVKYKVPSTIEYKIHHHKGRIGFGNSWYYSNGSIITLYSCDCGYRKELLEWQIPLPDTSDTQTARTIIQGLPQINK